MASNVSKTRPIYALKWFNVKKGGIYGAVATGFKYPPIGRWTKREIPSLCSSGYHVVDNVKSLGIHRYAANALFLVQCEGINTGLNYTNGKVAYERIKIIKRVDFLRKIANLSYLSDNELKDLAYQHKLPINCLLELSKQ